MVKWVTKRLDDKKENGKIVEELLDELVAKDTNREYGMDNMSSILINFSKWFWLWAYTVNKYYFWQNTIQVEFK